MALDYILLSSDAHQVPAQVADVHPTIPTEYEVGLSERMRSFDIESLHEVVKKHNGGQVRRASQVTFLKLIHSQILQECKGFIAAYAELELAIRKAVDFDDELDRGPSAATYNRLADVLLAYELPEHVKQFHDADLLRKEAVQQATVALHNVSWTDKKTELEAEQDVMNVIVTGLDDILVKFYKHYALGYISNVIKREGGVIGFLDLPTAQIEDLMVFLVKSTSAFAYTHVAEGGLYRQARALMITMLAKSYMYDDSLDYLSSEIGYVVRDFEKRFAPMITDSWAPQELSVMGMCDADDFHKALHALKRTFSPYGTFLRNTCQQAVDLLNAEARAEAESTPLADRWVLTPRIEPTGWGCSNQDLDDWNLREPAAPTSARGWGEAGKWETSGWNDSHHVSNSALKPTSAQGHCSEFPESAQHKSSSWYETGAGWSSVVDTGGAKADWPENEPELDDYDDDRVSGMAESTASTLYQGSEYEYGSDGWGAEGCDGGW